MSASTDRKNRLAARAAGTDKKTLAAQEEAKKKAKEKLRWTIGMILVIVLIAATLFLNSGLLYKTATALTVGSEKFSPAEVNYYYGNQYINMLNSYGSYASMLGLDTSNGITGLRKQECSMMDGGTWRDYFLQGAENDIAQITALLDYAKANGITLSEDEIAQIESGYEGVDEYAKQQGYAGADALFAMNYGKGVTLKLVKQGQMDQVLASKAYDQASEGFTYTDEELEQYYADLNGSRDLFDYLVYDVKAATAEGADAPDDTAKAEAAATADAISMAYQDGGDIEDITERFEAAVDSQTGETGEEKPTLRSGISGSGLTAEYSEWLMGERKAGDVTVIADADGSGSSVLVFLSRNDNHYKTASVRHILIRAEADADGNYTDEAKAAAKARAEEILAEYEAGEKTEESFAALAEQYSEDSGSNTNGGLYENIAKGQMVSEFDAFCFDSHKAGDTGIVYGESGSYAGYHVMYYVGEGDLYSNVIAENALRSSDVSAWMDELTAPYSPVEKFWIKLVG